MNRLLATMFCTMLAVFSSAQSDTVRISGRVTDMNEAPLEACIVTVLLPNDSAIVAYSMSDEEGWYQTVFMRKTNEVLLRLSGFNVKKTVRKIAAQSQTIDLRAEEESLALREVQLKAQKLWGSRDTLNYLVAAYMKDQDRTIGDVLRQLPGITIDENGTIKYQGTPINHFYIEDMDVLQGRYSLAANGIRAEDVATVQVLENHEHIKALQDQVPPESAAINLKLKKKAKGVWTKNLDLTAGFDTDGMLWNCSATVMYFGQGCQHFLYYGNDNTGKGSDTRQHYGGGGIQATALVDVLTPGGAPVGRSMRNNSHSLNLNNLNKLSETKQLHYDIAYSHDLQRRESCARTTYYLPDGNITVMSEDIAARHTTNDTDVQLTYENNADSRYVNNKLSLTGSWNDGHGTVQSNSEHIDQTSAVHTVGMSDAMRWVHRTEGGGGFELRSTNTFALSPQSLTVSGAMEAQQDVTVTQAATSNRFEMLRNLRRHRWTITPDATIAASYVGLSTTLNNTDGTTYYLHTSIGIGPVIRYVKGDLRITLNTPLALIYTTLLHETQRTKLRLQPSASLLWKASDNFTVNLDGSYAASETPWNQLVTTYIMRNYRYMSRYVAHLSDSHCATAHAKINFKDIFTSWFAYIDVSASRQWSDIIYGTTIGSDGHTVLQACPMPNHSMNYRCSAYIRKDIDWHAIQIEVTPSWSRNVSQLLRQQKVQDYHAASYAASARLAIDIVTGLRLDYSCSWSRHHSVAQSATNSISDFTGQATLLLTLVPKRLFVNINGSHTHNSGMAGQKDYAFANMQLTLKTHNKMEWKLDCTNLFDTRHFVSRSNTDMTEYYSEHYLRPRALLLSAAFSL